MAGSREAVYEDHRATEVAAALALSGAATATDGVSNGNVTDVNDSKKLTILAEDTKCTQPPTVVDLPSGIYIT